MLKFLCHFAIVLLRTGELNVEAGREREPSLVVHNPPQPLVVPDVNLYCRSSDPGLSVAPQLPWPDTA